MITSTSSISPPLPSEPRTLASVFPPVIQIYSFLADPQKHIIPVQPLSSDYTDDTTPRPTLLVQLELPPFAPGVVVTAFDVRPDPAYPPRRYDRFDTVPSLCVSKEFTQDPAKGVLVFEVQVMEPNEDSPNGPMSSRSFEMFVLRESLVSMAEQGEDRLRSARAVDDGFVNGRVEVALPWNQWGIRHSRILDATMRRRNWVGHPVLHSRGADSQVCTCSGYRFISLVASEDDSPLSLFEPEGDMVNSTRKYDLRLLDFSPYAVRKEFFTASSTEPDIFDVWTDAFSNLLPRSRDSMPTNPFAADADFEGGTTIPDSYNVEDDLEATLARDDPSSAAELQMLWSEVRELDDRREANARTDAALAGRQAVQSDDMGTMRTHDISSQIIRETGRSATPTRDGAIGDFKVESGPGGSDSTSTFKSLRREAEGDADRPTPSQDESEQTAGTSSSQPHTVRETRERPWAPTRAWQDSDERAEPKVRTRAFMEPSCLEAGRVWKYNVWSALPYREVVRELGIRANGVMMDDQRVIVTSVRCCCW